MTEQREFAFAREAQEKLIDEAFSMGAIKTWAAPAMRRHVHRLCRTLTCCPKPATAELLAARLDVSPNTVRGALAVALALGVVTREWVLGPCDRAVQHHALNVEAIAHFQQKLAAPQKHHDYQTLDPAPKFGSQVQPTAMEAGKKTAGEQVPVVSRDRARRERVSAAAVPLRTPPARNVLPKVLDRRSSSVLVLSPSPGPIPSAPPARSTPSARPSTTTDPLALTGDVCAAAVRSAVAAMPSVVAQQERILADIERACGAEAWAGFAPQVAEHIARLVLEGLHTKGDSGLAPRFFQSVLRTAARGVDAYGGAILCRRSFIIGRIGKQCRQKGLPWPFGRKGAERA